MSRFCFILILQLFLLGSSLHAQRLHTPDEIVKLMEESRKTYVFDSLEQGGIVLSFTPTSDFHPYVRLEVPGEVRVELKAASNYSKKQRKSIRSSDKSMKKGNFSKARICLEKVKDTKPGDTKILCAIGNTYAKENKTETAIYWYERALEFNFAETEARLKLAELYLSLNDTEKAVHHISYAHLFNRNNKDIMLQMESTFKEAGIHYEELEFNPIYTISPVGNNQVTIGYGHSVWAGYAAVKAVWEYEPNYTDEMTKISKQPAVIIQEKEALFNALITYERIKNDKKSRMFPLLHLLSEISLKKQIDHFLDYEILSRTDPKYILGKDRESLELLKNYLVVYRSRIKA